MTSADEAAASANTDVASANEHGRAVTTTVTTTLPSLARDRLLLVRCLASERGNVSLYRTRSAHKVVLQKSIPARICQLILYYC